MKAASRAPAATGSRSFCFVAGLGCAATVGLESDLGMGESLRGGYQLLVDMTTVTTLFPFVYIFAAGWKCGWRVSAACGLSVTALALVVAFVPPEGASWLYEVKMIGGCAAVVVAARMNFQYALGQRK